MRETKIYDLSSYPTNDRNGSYGGAAGSKEGINIGGEHWIVKYPQSTKGMKGALLSYTTAPLSEYIGSNIYQMLDIEAHDTMLGIRNNRLVVACKDFCENSGDLKEIRTLKNVFNEELNDLLETSLSSTSSDHIIDIDEIMIHLTYNPILKEVPNIKERFWQQFIIDVLINNNDRNNGNWGVLNRNGETVLAPVFDNGASFSNKNTDEKLAVSLQNLENSALNTTTVYSRNGKTIQARDILNIEDSVLFETAKTLVPKIKNSMNEIKNFINSIPSQIGNISVCSDIRKQFYTQSMELRLERLLIPLYEKAISVSKPIVKNDKPKKKSKGFEYGD